MVTKRSLMMLMFGLVGWLLVGGLGGLGCSSQTPNNENASGNEVATDGGTANDQASNPDSTSPTPDATTNPDGAPADNVSVPDPTSSTSLTWYKDVEPIVQRNCQQCHQGGGIAPFALTSYEEIKKKTALVQWAVETRRMPPWMPTEECHELRHSRRLKQSEVDTIVEWVKGGAPMGDPKDHKDYTPNTDKLAWTDVEVDTQVDYTPPTGKPDDFHCFLTKPVTQAAKELTGFQFLPGAKGQVHHVLIYGVNAQYSKTLAAKYPNGHWPCYTGALFNGNSLGNATLLGVWVPGTDVVRFPEGTGMSMNAGDQLVLEFHYNMGTRDPVVDRSKIRLQFAKEPVKYKLSLQLQAQFLLRIPPKAQDHSVSSAERTIPSDVRVWGYMPHMHKKGVKFRVDVQSTLAKSCLSNVPRWDYNWQQTFFFKDSVLLKTGDKIKVTCTFDNPTDRTVTWGDGTDDEMCLSFYFVSAP